jgi:Stress responsive A/B Barrel Domain
MFSVTRLLDVTADDRDRVLSAVRGVAEHSGALRWVAEPTDPRSRNGGDVLVHLRFADETGWCSVEPELESVLGDPAVTRVIGATHEGTPTRRDSSGTVYRALLLRVAPDAPADAVAQFEDELRSMPRYVDTIRAWQLSRVLASEGATAWTHVFEQEFTDADGLMGPYLMHPIHWAVVDRWFDPECTDVLVRDRVAHSFCAFPAPVLD